jgi:AcrR family transcriptional regulator
MVSIAPQTKSQRTRAKLVSATLAELCINGTFSAEAIASRTNTSVATFYGHFNSKQEALAAAFSDALDILVDVAQRTWQVERLLDIGLADTSRAGVAESIAYFKHHSLLFRVALAELPHSKAIRQIYRDHESHVLESYRRFVLLGQRAGLIRGREEDVEVIALSHLVLTQGLNNPHVLAAQADELIDSLAYAITANLAAQPPAQHL